MLEETLRKILSMATEFSVATGDATATITIVDYSGCVGDTVTITIDTTDHVLTEGVDWDRGSSNAEAASSLASAINLLTGVSASARDAVVVITAKYNITALATSGGADITISDAGSTTTLFDANKVWEVDKWKDAIVEITHLADGKHYYPTITSNTADTLTFGALAVTIAPGDHYEIRMALRLADIDKWGGTSQTGLDIGVELPKKVNKATTPVIYNVTMTDADTEYSQVLPANTKKYTIQTRDGTAFRMAFVTGKVATPTEPYLTIGTDGFHHEDLIEPASLTLFFACGEAAKVAEIIAWS
ncbi:hypothetical protein ES703_109492 [subsurface metagenome]